MAENCGFRSKFGGFNKEDVLTYINALQEEHGRELAAQAQTATAEREAYEKALSEANAALEEQHNTLLAEREEQERLQQLINEQYEANRELREEVAKSKEACETNVSLKARVAQLEQQNAAVKQEAASAHAAEEQELRRQLAALRAENQHIKEENRRYHELVSDVGRFVVDVRAMGSRYLEEANERCRTRLGTISRAIEELRGALDVASKELKVADEALDAQNNRAEQRLIELAEELDRSAASVTEVTGETTSESQFFREAAKQ